jgi:hypothetical protein
MMLEVGRPETEANKDKNANNRIMKYEQIPYAGSFLPAPDFGLPSIATRVLINITVEPIS